MFRINDLVKRSWLYGKLQYQHDASGANAAAVGYFASGQCQFNYPIRQGLFYGVCKIWWESGVIRSEEGYVQGRLDGVSRKWYSNGQLEVVQHYVRGVLHGVEKCWDVTGGLISAKAYLSGSEVPQEIAELLINNTLSAKHILEIKNAGLRRFCLESFGYERFLSQMPHEVLEQDGDQELVKIKWYPREEPIMLVKVKCPSTGAFYTLRVPPTVNRIKPAIAWTFGCNESEYSPREET